jgi:FkbM family methyltransferase
VPTDMTGAAAAPDFRILTVMRAAMRPSHEGGAFPTALRSGKKKRGRIRRILREVARPFEQLARSCRSFFKTDARPSRRQHTEARSPQVPDTSDFIQLTTSLENLRVQQALILKRVQRQPLTVAGGLVLMRMDDRIQLIPCGDLALIATLINADEYEPGVSAVLCRFCKNAEMAIDIGANVGLHTVSMARLLRPGGRLLALEPTQVKFQALQASIAANGLLSSVDARQIAAGGGDGERLLHLHPTADQNSLIPGPGIEGGSTPIAVAAVDSLISPGTSVDLVKINAQGAGFVILRGMTRVLVESPNIVVVMRFSAAHLERAGASPRELIHFMVEQGFSAFLVDDADGSLSRLDIERALAKPSANLVFGKRDLLQPTTAD